MELRGVVLSGGERLDLHNCQVDQVVAGAHLCGMVDLRTGRTCALELRHHGPCVFIAKDQARHRALGAGLG